MTFAEYLGAIRRQFVLVAVLACLGFVLGLVNAERQPYVYRASSTVIVFSQQAGNTSELVQGSSFVENLVTSYAVMATSELVLAPVIDELDLETTPRSLSHSISAQAPIGTVLITITANTGEPERARRLADAVARELSRAIAEVSPTIDGESAVDAKVIQTATAPTAPVSPNKRMGAMIGGVFGFAIGVAFAILRRMLGWRVNDVTDVALAKEGIPVVGEVVECERGTTLPAVVRAQPRSAEAESIRRLAANLHYLSVGGEAETLLVTSASPAEGKSSIASGLALVLAETNDNVLLIDADLRSPSVHEFTGLDNSIGLSSVVIGDFPLSTAVQSWGDSRVHVLTSGPVPPNPGQLVNSDVMQHLMAEARKTFDRIIIDTGPLLLVGDAVWLGRHVDNILCVARRGKTRTRSLAAALNALESARMPAVGVVISRVKRGRRSHYTYGTTPDRRWRNWRSLKVLRGRPRSRNKHLTLTQ